jgi:hypothetical protein
VRYQSDASLFPNSGERRLGTPQGASSLAMGRARAQKVTPKENAAALGAGDARSALWTAAFLLRRREPGRPGQEALRAGEILEGLST